METKGKLVKLTFLGDIMCKDDMISAYQNDNGQYNFDMLFEDMKSYFLGSDFVFGNLETPISYNNQNLTVEKWCFNSPFEFADAAFKAGINFVATANNHCLDRGIEGIHSTIKCLNQIGFYHTGIFSNKKKTPLIVQIDGLKIGIMSYTYGTNAFSNHQYLKLSERWMVNLFQRQELNNLITRWCFEHKKSLVGQVYTKILRLMHSDNFNCQPYERKEYCFYEKRKLCQDILKMKSLSPDIIVLYMHAGGQYNSEATDSTKRLVEFLLNKGVNIVVGSHEHVVHGGSFSRINDNKLATYSLGNFDGIAGVYDKPFDKMAEYSIAWNVYIHKQDGLVKFEKTTFSVLKTIPILDKPGAVKTVPVYNLILNEKDKNKRETLWNEMKEIAYRFAGIRIDALSVQSEYKILQNTK